MHQLGQRRRNRGKGERAMRTAGWLVRGTTERISGGTKPRGAGEQPEGGIEKERWAESNVKEQRKESKCRGRTAGNNN